MRARLFDDVMLDVSINSDWLTRAFAQAVRMSKSPNSKLKVVGGVLIAFLIVVALFMLREREVVTTDKTPSPPGVFAPSGTNSKPTAAEMVPIYTGGAGGNSSLGGTSAVGGGTHH